MCATSAEYTLNLQLLLLMAINISALLIVNQGELNQHCYLSSSDSIKRCNARSLIRSSAGHETTNGAK